MVQHRVLQTAYSSQCFPLLVLCRYEMGEGSEDELALDYQDTRCQMMLKGRAKKQGDVQDEDFTVS